MKLEYDNMFLHPKPILTLHSWELWHPHTELESDLLTRDRPICGWLKPARGIVEKHI